MREKLNKIYAAVESGRLHELMRGESSGSSKRDGSSASPEDKLNWLVTEIRKTQNRIESQRVDALAQVANPPKSRHPEITEAKNRMRHQTLAEISERLKWLTGHHRPWMKHLKNGPTPPDTSPESPSALS